MAHQPGGYARLWDRLMNLAANDLERKPGADDVVAALEEADGGDLDALRPAIDLARQRGLSLRHPMKRALAQGVSVYSGLGKLERLVRRIHTLRNAASFDAGEADALLDLWWIYLERHLDATTAFLKEASSVLVVEPSSRASFDAKVKRWSGAGKRNIAVLRQEAAHGNPNSQQGIDDEGLWEPMVLGGVSAEELEGMVEPTVEALRNRLRLWEERIRERASRDVAEGGHLCEELVSTAGDPTITFQT